MKSFNSLGVANNAAAISGHHDEKSQRLADQMVLAEARHIAQRKAQDQDCDCKDGMFPRDGVTDRRKFLLAAVLFTGVAGSPPLRSQPGRRRRRAHFISTCRRIRPRSRVVPLPPTAVMARARNSRRNARALSDAQRPYVLEHDAARQELGNLTPSGLHFERHHGGIPTIDPARHSLFVHGMVDTPKKFSMADIRRFPSVTRKHFIECSGNGLTEWRKPTMKTVQGTHGLLSTSEWTGVQFATIAREVG